MGLSIGHLASLYNYHMEKFDEAEKLYLKSIQISKLRPLLSNPLLHTLTFHPLTDLKLFGRAYSGLEYDYRGLIHIYEVIDDHDNYIKYNNMMEDWRALRTEVDNEQVLFSN